jgi:hypothetical protein
LYSVLRPAIGVAIIILTSGRFVVFVVIMPLSRFVHHVLRVLGK